MSSLGGVPITAEVEFLVSSANKCIQVGRCLSSTSTTRLL